MDTKNALKNHKHLNRCMTIGSFEVHLLMASTRLRLSHWNLVRDREKDVPQMAQLSTMGTNSFAIMLTFHSSDQRYGSH